MRPIRDIPIRHKLMMVVMAATTSALLLAGAGIVISDSVLFRGYLQRDLSGLARIIADNSTAALAFDDPNVAAQTLAALRARTHLIAACIYRPDGALFARYARDIRASCPPPRTGSEFIFGPGGLDVSRPISLDNRRVGTLTLLYDLDEIAARTWLYGGIVVGFVLAAALLAFVLASTLRGVITEPVSQLVRATTSVSETSDYSIRVQKVSGDELGVLVDTFNQMLAGIQSRDNSLLKAILDRDEALGEARESRERFRFMAESMPQKIFTATPAGDFDYCNRQWTEFTGLSFDRIRNGGWTSFVHPEDIGNNNRAWRVSVQTGEPFHMQHRLRRTDGAYRWHLSRAYAMRDETDNVTMWIGSDTDIHEQKEKEEELRRANDDLQQFAWSASHDLQEPVRNVAVFSELVAKRYRDRLDAEGQRYLEFLTEGGQRLAMLIRDLLAYTRAGVVEAEVPLTDSSAILERTLADLSEAIRAKAAVVTCDPMPPVYMGETHLQQVLQNIVGNALKYCDDPQPRIHIGAIKRGAAWILSVRDNGIGIEPEYREKIFGVFKRLHRDDKYGGTGIGLAICLRVVESYGGRIWVESVPGEGSTFFFTIPDRAAAIGAAAESAA